MSHLTRCTIILALGLCVAAVRPGTLSQTNQNKAITKSAGSISGQITVKGKGKAGIVVSARLIDAGVLPNPLSKATTDQQGNYRITELRAGTYQITPVAPAYVSRDSNIMGQRGKSVILADGEQVDNVDFSLERGGVITGKVSLADGKPVVEERVIISPVDQNDRRTPPTQFGQGSQTDDRGIYRVFGLPAGRYKVSVGQGQDTYFGGGRPGRPNYERVFFPDVTNPDEAKIIELGEGSEATNIDITISQSIAGFAVSGIAVDGETNQPLPGLRFGVRRMVSDYNSTYVGPTGVASRGGEFRFENLTPGKYQIVSFPQPNVDQIGEPLSFEIVDQDVTGLIFKTARGASVTGTVVLEGNADKAVQNKLAHLTVQTYVRTDSTAGAFVQTSPINQDGSFRVGGLQAGQAQMSLSSQDRGSVTGFIIARTERDGVVYPRGLEIKSGEQVSGVKLFVIYGSGTVRGTIKIENGPLPADARLWVGLMKPEQPPVSARAVDARGRFSVEGVPAGTYELNVSCYITGVRGRQPSTKQTITVSEGATTEVEVVLDLKPDQAPRP
jgi:hypothetical protein